MNVKELCMGSDTATEYPQKVYILNSKRNAPPICICRCQTFKPAKAMLFVDILH